MYATPTRRGTKRGAGRVSSTKRIRFKANLRRRRATTRASFKTSVLSLRETKLLQYNHPITSPTVSLTPLTAHRVDRAFHISQGDQSMNRDGLYVYATGLYLRLWLSVPAVDPGVPHNHCVVRCIQYTPYDKDDDLPYVTTFEVVDRRKFKVHSDRLVRLAWGQNYATKVDSFQTFKLNMRAKVLAWTGIAAIPHTPVPKMCICSYPQQTGVSPILKAYTLQSWFKDK